MRVGVVEDVVCALFFEDAEGCFGPAEVRAGGAEVVADVEVLDTGLGAVVAPPDEFLREKVVS